MSSGREQISRRGSIAAVALLLAIALAGLGLARVMAPDASGGLVVKVTLHGEVVDMLSLDTDTRRTYSGEDGQNTVVVEAGAVHIEEADCAGGDCMKQGKISQPSQLLVCLPHQLIVEIVPADATNVPSVYTGVEQVGEGGLDAVAR